MTALAVAIPSAHAANRQGAKGTKPADRAKKKKGSTGSALRGPGREATHGPRPGHGIGAGTSNVLARRPVATGGTTSRRAGGPRVATASSRTSAAGRSRTSTAKKTTKRKSTKPVRKTRARVQPRGGAASQHQAEMAAAGGAPEAGDFDAQSAQGFEPEGYEAGDGPDGYDGAEKPRRGIGSGVKKAFKVLGMGVLAVGIGAVFIAGGAPLLALSVPVMMFGIGSLQILAKPEIDPNQMVLPQGGDDLNDDGMSPQARYRYLARDHAMGGSLPGGFAGGLTPPPGAQVGSMGF
ncbi:MAG TPA: hypothetical protein VMZ28_31000, partial [Kofleriaceae bacterium]|nr:hypothetical protein [Kofleriaceae bacterium]